MKVGPRREKTCLRGLRQSKFKSFSSATETSYKIVISPVAKLHMILSKMRITKALIRLSGCAGWSAPVLFEKNRRQIFSRRGPFIFIEKIYLIKGSSETNIVILHSKFKLQSFERTSSNADD